MEPFIIKNTATELNRAFNSGDALCYFIFFFSFIIEKPRKVKLKNHHRRNSCRKNSKIKRSANLIVNSMREYDCIF